jgi:hypothetical protein
MNTESIQISEVYYNASNQCFEGLVTIHQAGASRRYACAIDAPITMSFQDAAHGLRKHALRRHENDGGALYSETPMATAKHRAGGRNFNARRWLGGIMKRPGEPRAA